MRIAWLFLLSCLFACGGNTRNDAVGRSDSITHGGDSTGYPTSSDTANFSPVKRYSNARFRDVTVQVIDSNRFVIQGEAQIFEVNFGWVVEDGHRELKKGFEMTNAGAPEWGKFMFPVEVEKERPNSTLTLVLFESSAKDGSRQHELFIPLP